MSTSDYVLAVFVIAAANMAGSLLGGWLYRRREAQRARELDEQLKALCPDFDEQYQVKKVLELSSNKTIQQRLQDLRQLKEGLLARLNKPREQAGISPFSLHVAVYLLGEHTLEEIEKITKADIAEGKAA